MLTPTHRKKGAMPSARATSPDGPQPPSASSRSGVPIAARLRELARNKREDGQGFDAQWLERSAATIDELLEALEAIARCQVNGARPGKLVWSIDALNAAMPGVRDAINKAKARS